MVSLKGQLNDSVRLDTEGPISGRVVQGLFSLPLVQEYAGDMHTCLTGLLLDSYDITKINVYELQGVHE